MIADRVSGSRDGDWRSRSSGAAVRRAFRDGGRSSWICTIQGLWEPDVMFSMVLETRTGKLIKDRRENRNTRHTRKPEESLNLFYSRVRIIIWQYGGAIWIT